MTYFGFNLSLIMNMYAFGFNQLPNYFSNAYNYNNFYYSLPILYTPSNNPSNVDTFENRQVTQGSSSGASAQTSSTNQYSRNTFMQDTLTTAPTPPANQYPRNTFVQDTLKPVPAPKFELPKFEPPQFRPIQFEIPKPTVTKPIVTTPSYTPSNTLEASSVSSQNWVDINDLSNKFSWLNISKSELDKGRQARRNVWNRNKNVSKPELNTQKNCASVKKFNDYLKSLNLQYDDVKAKELAENMYQGAMGNKSYGYCFAFVKMGLEETFDNIGYLPGASAADAADIFPNDRNVKRHLTKLPDSIVKNLNFDNLPAGCIIVYKTGNNVHKSQHGHIEVALGNGNTCSDYIKSTHSGQKPRGSEQWKNIEVYVPTMPA